MGLVTDLAASIRGIVDILKKNEGSLESSISDIQKTAANVRIVTDRAVELTESVPQITGQITSSITQLQSTVDSVAATVKTVLARLEGDLGASADDLAVSMRTIRQVSSDIQGAVTQLTAQESVIGRLSSPAISQSLAATVKNLEDISKNLLTVTDEAQKIVVGVRQILQVE